MLPLQPPTPSTRRFVLWSLLLMQSVVSLRSIRVRLDNVVMMHECLQKSTHVAPKIDPTSWKNRPQIDAKSILKVLLAFLENISWKVEHLEADRARFQREPVEKRTKSARKMQPFAPPKRSPNRLKNRSKIDAKSIVEVLLSVLENISWKVEHQEADRARLQREPFEKRTKNAASCPPKTDPKSIQKPDNFCMLF